MLPTREEALAGAEGVLDIEERMADVKRRYGVYPQEKWESIGLNKKLIKPMVLWAVILCVAVVSVYIMIHNKGNTNIAVERGDGLILNGDRYVTSYLSEEYTVTNVLIGRTDTGLKLYEIEEYPDYEYIVGYSLWDGTIYKRAQK